MVEALNPSDDLIAEILRLPGVSAVNRTSVGFTVQVVKGRDVRSEVSKAVVVSGASLLSIGYSRSELDEAYLASIRRSGA